jgi:integrase
VFEDLRHLLLPKPPRETRKTEIKELTVQKALPQPREYQIRDSETKGFVLVVRPSGHKAFKLRYSADGHLRWFHIGDTTEIALADARKKAYEIRQAVLAGQDPHRQKMADRAAKRTEGTFADLYTRYLEEKAKIDNKSWRQADGLIRKHVLPRWSRLRATEITRADVRALLGKIKAPILHNQILASLSAVLTWGVKQDLLEKNVSKLIDRKPTKKRDTIIEDQDMPRFWEEFDKAGLLGRQMKVLLLLGQRPGEVRRMRYEHIVGNWWCMPGEVIKSMKWPGTKNHQAHRIFLPEVVRGLIGTGTEGFVFDGFTTGGAGLMRDISATLNVKKPVRPHDLRRTHGSTVTRLGFGRDAMHRLQNHKEGGLSDVYDVYAYEKETITIMSVVAQFLVSLSMGKEPETNVVQFQAAK